jgi:hypothetical protein
MKKLVLIFVLASLTIAAVNFLSTVKLTFPTLNKVSAQTLLPSDSDWYMAGANPERSSWVREEVRGGLNVEWFRPIEPYIQQKTQPIATNGRIYVSTSKGLYAFSATNGSIDWVYPTEMPLGHSPTVVTVNGRLTAYVGGYDRKIHAVDTTNIVNGIAQTLSGYTPHEAGAGFETNPLVIYVNGAPTIFAGNRDGKFYALDAVTGAKIWEYKTAGPILFSAAYKNNTLYFASNDSYAYAVNATTGEQIWKSTKFPGGGFHSYWPVIYTEKATGKDYVIFGGSGNIRPGDGAPLDNLASFYLFPQCHTGTDTEIRTNCPWGDPVGPISNASATQTYWTAGTQVMDVSNIINYTEDYPQNRSAFILDAGSGLEYTFDSDGDGRTEYAPFTHANVTKSGSRYPAVVGSEGIMYMNSHYASAPYITRGMTVGWKFGDHFISRVYRDEIGLAQDEPTAFAGGGNLIYYSLMGDREAGAFDITIPYGQANRSWYYYDQGGYSIMTRIPDYQPMYNDGDTRDYNDVSWAVYSGKNYSRNGVYGKHGTPQSPPIPYQGKVFMLRGNTLISWVPTSSTTTRLPLADIVPVSSSSTMPTPTDLTQKLEGEIQKMLAAGHLRPGYKPTSIADQYGRRGGYYTYIGYGELFDYFQNPSETVVTLIQALSYLSPALQDQVRTYLQTNYGPGALYDITRIVHIGWDTGAARETFDTHQNVWNNYFSTFGARTTPICTNCGYWTTFPPYSFYAAFKYAQTFGNAQAILTAINSGSKLNDLNTPPTDTYLLNFPNVLNQYIAGFHGYLKLQELAGVSETTAYRNTYNRLLALRANNFDKDTPFWPNRDYGSGTAGNYFRTMSIARNFMYLTSELGDFLNQDASASAKVQEAVNEYEYVAPYWFVSKYESTVGEGTLQQLYDYPAIFQAKAWILKEPQSELVKYLDVPAFERGDLFYLQNLVATIEASTTTTSSDINGDGSINADDALILFNNWFNPATSTVDIYSDNRVNGIDFSYLKRDWKP